VETNELDFGDITIQELPVRIAGKHYILREASGEANAKYRDAIMRGTKVNKEADVVSIDGVAGAELTLLSYCLFETGSHPSNGSIIPTASVPVQTIRGWPTRVTQPLFRKLEEMSGLGEFAKKAQEAAKNLPSGSTDGSI